MKRLVCESSNRENICGNKFDFSWKRNTWKSTFRFCKRRWKLFSTLTKFPSYRTSFRTRNFRNLGLFRDSSFPQISIAITTPSDSMAPLKICLDNIQIVGKIKRSKLYNGHKCLENRETWLDAMSVLVTSTIDAATRHGLANPMTSTFIRNLLEIYFSNLSKKKLDNDHWNILLIRSKS